MIGATFFNGMKGNVLIRLTKLTKACSIVAVTWERRERKQPQRVLDNVEFANARSFNATLVFYSLDRS